METTAIIKGTKNLAAAQKLADFAVSKGAYEMYGKFFGIVRLLFKNSANGMLILSRICLLLIVTHDYRTQKIVRTQLRLKIIAYSWSGCISKEKW